MYKKANLNKAWRIYFFPSRLKLW